MEGGLVGGAVWLGALACFASFHILSNIALESRPPVIAEDEFSSLEPSWMSCDWGVVVVSDNLLVEALIYGNINPVAVRQHTIWCLFPAIFLAFQCVFDS